MRLFQPKEAFVRYLFEVTLQFTPSPVDYTYLDNLDSFPNIRRPTISSNNDPKLTQERYEKRSTWEEEDENYRGKKTEKYLLMNVR